MSLFGTFRIETIVIIKSDKFSIFKFSLSRLEIRAGLWVG
jgi:hypothetical protein